MSDYVPGYQVAEHGICFRRKCGGVCVVNLVTGKRFKFCLKCREQHNKSLRARQHAATVRLIARWRTEANDAGRHDWCYRTALSRCADELERKLQP